ncbi:MAG: DUF4127 family protein [Selenomonadaceae bacterium]|nr:DUF4127 family protein [Selenomonadaceae bacterium]
MRRIFFAVMLMIFSMTSAAAAQEKILYIPIDNRPCNFAQVVQVAEKLGYEILTPPDEILGSRDRRGDPDKIWQWLFDNAGQTNFAVLSTDALLYGSLVASRLQDLDPPEIMLRAKRFEDLDKKFPFLQIFAFSTIMRTPRNVSYPGIEPDYYATHGPKIFQYTALLDKQETKKLSRKEKRSLENLQKEIPAEYLDDWFSRRNENFDANKYLIDLTRRGVFEYFLIGCDDSAEYSQTHLESRHLLEHGKGLDKTVMQITSGADELGMLMVARAINFDKHEIPFVSVTYNAGKGAETFPTYCNEPIGVSVDVAIVAVGGLKIPAPERADLVVAVNTRANGKTFEATNPKRNKIKMRGDLKNFMTTIKNFTAKNYPVAIADVAFANGADNALMTQLERDDLQYKIRAYGGWNTATNSSGFLIGAGVLTKHMDNDAVAELLTTRYLDDWIYEANVRQEIIAEMYGMGVNPWNIGDDLPQIEKSLNDKMIAFAEKNLRLPNRWRLENLKVTLPWRRSFECYARFEVQ